MYEWDITPRIERGVYHFRGAILELAGALWVRDHLDATRHVGITHLGLVLGVFDEAADDHDGDEEAAEGDAPRDHSADPVKFDEVDGHITKYVVDYDRLFVPVFPVA